ncbi:MAG: hypothetical protein WC879_10205 [Melioribacteraceae bacterium]
MFSDQLLFPGGLPVDVGLIFHSLPANVNVCPLVESAVNRSEKISAAIMNDVVLISFPFLLRQGLTLNESYS